LPAALWILFFVALVRVRAVAGFIVSFDFSAADFTLKEGHKSSRYIWLCIDKSFIQ